MASRLDALKADRPTACFTCGNWHLHPDGIHSCHENPVIADLKAALADAEKRCWVFATLDKVWAEGMEKENDALRAQLASETRSDGHYLVCVESPVVTAMASALQQHEATIAGMERQLEEANAELAVWRGPVHIEGNITPLAWRTAQRDAAEARLERANAKIHNMRERIIRLEGPTNNAGGLDVLSPEGERVTRALMDAVERAEDAEHERDSLRFGFDTAQAELVKAQATIQQQARELEEALGNILNYSNDPPLVKYAQEALAREAARSQQAENKETE